MIRRPFWEPVGYREQLLRYIAMTGEFFAVMMEGKERRSKETSDIGGQDNRYQVRHYRLVCISLNCALVQS